MGLQLLETCVKNCGEEFHIALSTSDIFKDMRKVAKLQRKVSHSNDPHFLDLGIWSCKVGKLNFGGNVGLKVRNYSYCRLTCKSLTRPWCSLRSGAPA